MNVFGSLANLLFCISVSGNIYHCYFNVCCPLLLLLFLSMPLSYSSSSCLALSFPTSSYVRSFVRWFGPSVVSFICSIAWYHALMYMNRCKGYNSDDSPDFTELVLLRAWYFVLFNGRHTPNVYSTINNAYIYTLRQSHWKIWMENVPSCALLRLCEWFDCCFFSLYRFQSIEIT